MTAPVGLLLAAGRGRRFGSTKQLALTPSGLPLVASAFDTIESACTAMIVVTGHDREAVIAALGERVFTSVEADPDAPMVESIRAGLRAIRTRDAAASALIQPGDHPDVAASTLRTVLVNASPDRGVMPECGGKGGHPVLVPPALFDRILDEPLPDGLRGLWLADPGSCLRVVVDDATSTQDVDRRSDLPSGP